MDVEFTIRPREAVLTPGEALTLDAEAINRTSVPISVAAFNAAGNQRPRYTVTGPHGEVFVLGPAGRPEAGPEAPRDVHQQVVDPGRRYAEPVVIGGAFTQPGQYEVVAETAVYAGSGGPRRTVTARAILRVDQIHSIQVAVARIRGQEEVSQLAGARLIHGERIHAVERRSFTDSGMNDGVIQASAIIRSANVSPEAAGLVSFYSAEPEVHVELDWIAWLELGGVCANTRCLGSRVLRSPLAPGRYAIVPPGLLSADGDFDVLIVNLEEPCIRLVRFPRPEAGSFPEPDFAALGEVSDLGLDSEEDEEFNLYTVREPASLWSIPLPCAPGTLTDTGLAAAIAPARLGGGRRVAVAVQRSGGVAVLHLAYEDDKPPKAVATVFLPGATRFEADRPGILVDDANNTRVAILVSLPVGENGETHLSVADLSFDGQGGVRVQTGMGLQDLGPMADRPRACAAGFWAGPNNNVRRDCTVVQEDGRAVIGLGEGRKPRAFEGTPAIPLEVMSLQASCAVAIMDNNGQFRLVPV